MAASCWMCWGSGNFWSSPCICFWEEEHWLCQRQPYGQRLDVPAPWVGWKQTQLCQWLGWEPWSLIHRSSWGSRVCSLPIEHKAPDHHTLLTDDSRFHRRLCLRSHICVWLPLLLCLWSMLFWVSWPIASCCWTGFLPMPSTQPWTQASLPGFLRSEAVRASWCGWQWSWCSKKTLLEHPDLERQIRPWGHYGGSMVWVVWGSHSNTRGQPCDLGHVWMCISRSSTGCGAGLIRRGGSHSNSRGQPWDLGHVWMCISSSSTGCGAGRGRCRCTARLRQTQSRVCQWYQRCICGYMCYITNADTWWHWSSDSGRGCLSQRSTGTYHLCLSSLKSGHWCRPTWTLTHRIGCWGWRGGAMLRLFRLKTGL